MLHDVGIYCVQFETSQTFSQHMPTFLLFSGDRWARWLHSHMMWLYSVILKVYCFVTFSLTFPSSLLKLSVLVYMWLGVFSRWQRKIAIAMHFLVFHRLYSSSAIMAGERDKIAVSQRVLGRYQTRTPLGITVKATLPNMLWSFEHSKANISQHYPNNVGWCCANMLWSFARAFKEGKTLVLVP